MQLDPGRLAQSDSYENATAAANHKTPSRLVNDIIDHTGLEPEAKAFYTDNRLRSERFMQLEQDRREYVDQHPGKLVIFTCIDEKEQDTEKAFGLVPGVANVYPTAGNKIGEVNLVLCQEIQKRIDRAVQSDKVVLLLFITHESASHPEDDGCAAWEHDSREADKHAIYQVKAFNRDYVDRDCYGNVAKRHMVAIRLKSITDKETRIWFGSNGQVDPDEFLSRNGSMGDGPQLFSAIYQRFAECFPEDDPCFSGLGRDRRTALLRQMALMFKANLGYAREVAKGEIPRTESGHRGTRILVGRGWEMYDEVGRYFKVSDLTPDYKRECQISGKYVLKNALIRQIAEKDSGLVVPFHVNVPFDLMRCGDRCGSIRHAMNLARAIKKDWIKRLHRTETRERLYAELRQALEHDGIPHAFHPDFSAITPEVFNFYVSVSPRETRLLELVATGGDL
ncbi:MAG: hypothetical protein WC551_02445 [Patescibacteria group bacterium]